MASLEMAIEIPRHLEVLYINNTDIAHVTERPWEIIYGVGIFAVWRKLQKEFNNALTAVEAKQIWSLVGFALLMDFS